MTEASEVQIKNNIKKCKLKNAKKVWDKAHSLSFEDFKEWMKPDAINPMLEPVRNLVGAKLLKFNEIEFSTVYEKDNRTWVSDARHIVIFVMYDKCGLHQKEIGEILNDRQPATILNSSEIVNNYIDTKDPIIDQFRDFLNYDYHQELFNSKEDDK